MTEYEYEPRFNVGDAVRWLGVTGKVIEQTAPGMYLFEVPTGEQYDTYESELSLIED